MARSTTLPRRGGFTLIPPTLTLALWRLKRTWSLLLGAGLGMLAAVVLVCAVPLFSQVAISAGLRSALAASGSSPDINVQVSTSVPSLALRDTTQQHLDHIMQQNFGKYISPTPQFETQTKFLPVKDTKSGAMANVQLLGADLTAASSHLHLTTGSRMPATGAAGEMLVPQIMADRLNLKLGSEFIIQQDGHTNTNAHTGLPPLRVVGIFSEAQARDPYWHDHDFSGQNRPDSSSFFIALLPSDAVLALENTASQSTSQVSLSDNETPSLLWYYHLNLDRFDANSLDALVLATQTLQNQVPNTLSSIPNINQGFAYSFIFEEIYGFKQRIFYLQFPVTFLLIEVLGMVLFFVSLMADIVVDRQADAIAVLRSRGASRQQIFGALATQTLGMGLIALVAGPLIAIVCVRLIAQQALNATDQGALNVIAGSPIHTALSIGWYALFAFLGSLLAMVVALNRAMGMDVLALRREASRSTRRPVWQRLNLDLIAVIIAIFGYFSYAIAIQNVDPRVQRLLSPLSMIAPIFLLIACTMLFMRFFPLLLRLGAFLAGKRRGATGMLALAQMSRAPRQAMRMTILLALSTGFTIFALIFVASQNQHIRDTAAYQVGADFSGQLPAVTAASAPGLAAQTAQYQQTPGITSASLGYVTDLSSQSNAAGLSLHFIAADADTYGQTAIWPTGLTKRSVPSMMQQLSDSRVTATGQETMPAIVDDTLWNVMHLDRDPHFALSIPGYVGNELHFVAITHVASIPGNGANAANGGDSVQFLVDYQTFAAIVSKESGGIVIPQNYAWLRTQDDAASLANVRNVLSTGDLRLTGLQDRRAITTASLENPLQIDLLSVLGLSAATAILLALVGALVASWISARNRLTNFAVLRALGTAPRQLATILLSEQGLLYVTALVLGVLIGGILTASVLPSLVFANIISGQSSYIGSSMPPIQTVIPWTQMAALFAGLVAIFLGSLALMTRVVARPSVSQTLRLNED